MSQQPGLFDPPRARTRDPLSSHASADRITRSGAAQRQMDAVIACLRLTPGLTSAELSARHGLDRHAVARRLPEAERLGLVRRIEYGSRQVRWEVK